MPQLTEIDGVPTLFVPKPGPVRAGLTFRVGRADETLATSGLTHLLEHLALHRHGVADYHYNGATAPLFTLFLAEGTAEEAVEYLNGVCEGLADPPIGRMEAEKAILRTEAAGRSASAVSSLALWRHGPQGVGLVAYPEWGLYRLTPDEVREWAQTRFTRDNAVLWVSGPELPPGLKLNLPSGQRMPLPPTGSVLPRLPVYYAEDQGLMALDAQVPRGAAARLFADVLERELFRALRQEGGYSYSVKVDYDAYRADGASITATADALPRMQDAMVGGFLDVLARLAAGHIDQRDLDVVRGKAIQALESPDHEDNALPWQAIDLLLGRPLRTPQERKESLAQVTVEDLVEVARQVRRTALYRVPAGHQLDWADIEEAPCDSGSEIGGRRFASRSGEPFELVIGEGGVSLSSPETVATVRFAECAAVLAWPDGARRLIGADGFQIQVEPTMFAVDEAGLARIEAGVRADRVIPLPARPAELIPQPAAKPKQAKGRSSARRVLVPLIVTIALVTMFVQFANAWRPSDGSLAEKAILWLMIGTGGSILWTFFALMGVLRERSLRKGRA